MIAGALGICVMADDHNRVIDAEARQLLKPFGLTRKGKSRVWLDDHGWWLIQVEFQPSAWSRGSYLNVGVNWMLYEGSVGAFHVGSRINVPFISATGNEHFAEDARHLASRAKEEVAALRSKFADLQAAVGHYAGRERRGIWDDYFYGVLLGLSGEASKAQVAFHAVPSHRVEYGWEKALSQRASELSRLVSDRAAFEETIRGIVLRTRSIGALPDLERDIVFS